MYTLTELCQALQTKQVSSVEITHYYLEQIAKHTHLNAFITVDPDFALAQAKQADKQLKEGSSVLTGIPIAHKDIFCTHHLPTTCGSKMLANYISPYQATIVNNLQKAGAIILGKTNMDEFAMGSTNETSYFGPVKNPWDVKRVAGGSSGGSAAAVAAGLSVAATGSDTGGSIRQPASFCNLLGLKPTYGLASRFGMVAFASSLDQAGIFAQNAADAALLLSAIAGFDAKDSTSLKVDIPNYSQMLNQPTKGLRIGVPSFIFTSQVDSVVQTCLQKSIQVFDQADVEIIEIDLPLSSYWVPCYYVIACAEASSNLSRYDGLRFGYRSQKAHTLEELITCSRSEGFGAEVKRRILTGTYVLSSGYYDAYYLQALKIRRLIQEELLSALNQVDFIITPTTPSTALPLNAQNPDPTQIYLADIFTVAANLAGLPAISIPGGFIEKLPIGLQLIGPPLGEAKLLNLASYYQQNTNWHHYKPS